MFNNIIKVSSEGLHLVLAVTVFGWILALLGFKLISFLFFCLTVLFLFFFRDPNRNVTHNENAIISPADGKIVEITDIEEPNFLNQNRRRVSIFLSLLDCHVNRFPVSGKVLATKYVSGKFGLAFQKEASGDNEKLSTLIELNSGLRIVLVQIAGFLARRIVSRASVGKYFNQGERFGIIKFGSRVDLFLPMDSQLEVEIGNKVKGGETVIAWLKEKED